MAGCGESGRCARPGAPVLCSRATAEKRAAASCPLGAAQSLQQERRLRPPSRAMESRAKPAALALPITCMCCTLITASRSRKAAQCAPRCKGVAPTAQRVGSEQTMSNTLSAYHRMPLMRQCTQVAHSSAVACGCCTQQMCKPSQGEHVPPHPLCHVGHQGVERSPHVLYPCHHLGRVRCGQSKHVTPSANCLVRELSLCWRPGRCARAAAATQMGAPPGRRAPPPG